MLRKGLLLLLVGALLAAWTATGVAFLSWSMPALADDDDDGGDDDGGDDDGGGRGGGDDRWRPRWQRPRVAPRVVVPSELLGSGLSAADLDRLRAQGFIVLHSRDIGLIGAPLARLRTPPRVGRSEALRRARRTAPSGSFTNNDLYRRPPQVSYRPSGESCGERCEAFAITAWTLAVGRCGSDIPIGVVDTGVDVEHPSLAGTPITLRTIRSPDRPASDMDHGTAIVSLLIGKADSEVVGIVPGARLLVADAFHGRGRASSADAFDLIAALDWLVSEGVKVVNLSLSGPANEHLERAVARIQEKGVLLIAASGRPDRSRVSGYPAKYPGVIAVSAVDNRLRPSRLASRGDHISFAAPGSGIAVARRPSGVRRVAGTSFAAPFVSAAYAIGLARSQNASQVTDLLARSAKDLGSPGRDPVYGWGLLQFTALPSC